MPPYSPPLPPGPPAEPPAPPTPPAPPALPAPPAPPAAATPSALSPPASPPALSLLSLLLLLLLALQSVLLAYLLLRRHASALREYKGVLLAYLASGAAWRCLRCMPSPPHDATRAADAEAAAEADAPPHAPQAGLLAALRHRCAPCLARLPCLAPLAKALSAPAAARGTPAEQAPPGAAPPSFPTRPGAAVRPEPLTSAVGDSGRAPLLPPRTVRSDADRPPSSGARSKASTPQQALVDVGLQLRRLKLNQKLRLLNC